MKIDIANGLYKELIPRLLFAPIAHIINVTRDDYLGGDGTMDTVHLVRSFQMFFHNHVDRLVKLIDYKAAGYVLVFQALLQKLDEMGFSIERDYGIGQGFVALKLKKSYPVRYEAVFLLKLVTVWSLERYKQMLGRLETDAEGYMADVSATNGGVHIIAINVNPEFSWDGRPPYAARGTAVRPLHIWGF
jgi:hypothetical protein